MRQNNFIRSGLAWALLAAMVLSGCGFAFAAEETEAFYEDDMAVVEENDPEDPALPDEPENPQQSGNTAPEGPDLAGLGLIEEIGEEASSDMDASSIITDDAVLLSLNESAAFVPGQSILYKFTPEESGAYCISSFEKEPGVDPYVRLYDKNGNLLKENDDIEYDDEEEEEEEEEDYGEDDEDYDEEDWNFSLIYRMQKDRTYYILPGTNGEDETTASYKFSITRYEENLGEKAILPGSTETIPIEVEREFYFTAPSTTVLYIFTSSTQEEKDYYLILNDYEADYRKTYICDYSDEELENDIEFRLTIEAGHTIWFTLYGNGFEEDGETLSLTLSEVFGANPDDYKYTGSEHSEEPCILPRSPEIQTVQKNDTVQLKIGWTVPEDESPYFIWTVNDVEQSAHGDTFTFCADGSNITVIEFEDTNYYLYEIRVIMMSADRSKSYDDFYFNVYLPEQPHTHHYGAWIRDRAATALAAGSRHRVCSGCEFIQTQVIPKLGAFILLNLSGKLPMKTGQKTNKVTAKLQTGDRIASWTSSNPKVVTVDAAGTLKAGKKPGKATITAITAAGARASFTVAVKKSKVKTSKIVVASRSVTLSKGQTFDLMTEVLPITSQDKVSYTMSKKGIVKVSKKGVITGKKKGKATITIKSGKKKFKVNVKVI